MLVGLQQKVDELHARQRRQAVCRHPERSFVANRRSNGAIRIWWRCESCWANLLGPGRSVTREQLEQIGVDVEDLEVVSDESSRGYVCRACGRPGPALHLCAG